MRKARTKMPARPMVLDQISERLRKAATVELVKVICSFNDCKVEAKSILNLGFKDGKRDLFGLCTDHEAVVRAAEPMRVCGKASRQGAFFV